MTSVRDAQYLWIDADVRRAARRRWLELPTTVAAYFAAVDTLQPPPPDLAVLIKLRRAEAMPYCLSYRPEAAADPVAPWQLDLPTESRGVPHYAGMVVRFCRTAAADMAVFELDTEPTASAAAQRWQRIALARGHAGELPDPPRAFGYW